MMVHCSFCNVVIALHAPPGAERSTLSVACASCADALSLEAREQRAAFEADLRKQMQYDEDAEADRRAFGLEVDDEDRPVERTGHV